MSSIKKGEGKALIDETAGLTNNNSPVTGANIKEFFICVRLQQPDYVRNLVIRRRYKW